MENYRSDSYTLKDCDQKLANLDRSIIESSKKDPDCSKHIFTIEFKDNNQIDLKNYQSLKRKVFFFIFIQNIFAFLMTAFIYETDSIRKYVIEDKRSTCIFIISGLISIICSILLITCNRLRSTKPYNLIILEIFAFSKLFCFAILLSTFKYRSRLYSCYVSRLLSCLITFTLYLICGKIKIKNATKTEVSTIIIFYFLAILILPLIYNDIFKRLLLAESLFLIIIVVDFNKIIQKYNYQIKSKDYLFVTSTLLCAHVYFIQLVFLLLTINYVIIWKIFGFTC